MPNWKELQAEIVAESKKHPQNPGIAIDVVRRKYLLKTFNYTGRNVIAYYSGWLQKPKAPDSFVNDKDISGFMLCINKLDKAKGLDLIMHTPGGSVAATESLVRYLKSIFGNDIRAIVPQLSMSAGTMIAFCAKEIFMGKHSSLGPIDPQIGGVPAEAVVKEFDKAKKEILANPRAAGYWQFIISKYHPTYLSTCAQAIALSNDLAREWLSNNMCAEHPEKIDEIIKLFSNHTETQMHARHIMADRCKEVGLNITDIEADDSLQDLFLTIHHAFMHTFNRSAAVKIVENHQGAALIEHIPGQAGIPNFAIPQGQLIKVQQPGVPD